MIPRKAVRVGLVVRRAGNPRTDVGRARRATTYTVAEIYGDFRKAGFSRALLKGGGQSLWVSDFTRWDVAKEDGPC